MKSVHLEFLQGLLRSEKGKAAAFQRNVVKEYIQVLALSYIYSHPDFRDLLFYGGSCLRHCFGLERLSEDLDFVDASGKVDILKLSGDLAAHLSNEFGKKVVSRRQKFRAYLKIPILTDLNLAGPAESDFLFIKIEVYKDIDFCRSYDVQIRPLFKFGKSLLIRTFDLPTLMSTKIRAVLFRRWEKTSKQGATLCRVKGRDYYDLMWYFQKGVEPNFNCLDDIKDRHALRDRLMPIIEKLDYKSIRLDLEAFISDAGFVDDLSKNIGSILRNQLETFANA